MDDIRAALGQAFRRAREIRRLSQHELAELAGVPQPTLSRIERGQRKPGVDIMRQLCLTLGLTPDELFTMAGLDGAQIAEQRVLYDEHSDRVLDAMSEMDQSGRAILADIADVLRKRMPNGRHA